MKRMFKTAAAFIAAAVIIMFSACNMQTMTTVSYDVETGDKVALQLMTGYIQDGKNPFSVSKDGKTLITGSFLTAEQYDEYVSLIENGGTEDETIERIEQGVKDNNIFCYYSSENGGSSEYDFILKISDSNTAVLLRGTGSQADVRECFSAMSFILKN